MVSDGFLISEYFLAKKGAQIFNDTGEDRVGNWTQINP